MLRSSYCRKNSTCIISQREKYVHVHTMKTHLHEIWCTWHYTTRMACLTISSRRESRAQRDEVNWKDNETNLLSREVEGGRRGVRTKVGGAVLMEKIENIIIIINQESKWFHSAPSPYTFIFPFAPRVISIYWLPVMGTFFLA